MSNTSEGILESIKAQLGVAHDDDAFDSELILEINSALVTINQLGVGERGFSITGKDETWTDFYGDRADLEAVKTCVYLMVRKIFDPPTNSSVLESINRTIEELEWRINAQVDYMGDMA